MNRKAKLKHEQKEACRMIIEMIEASMVLSGQKGKHPVTKGCNCIVCADRRKRIMMKTTINWQYRL